MYVKLSALLAAPRCVNPANDDIDDVDKGMSPFESNKPSNVFVYKYIRGFVTDHADVGPCGDDLQRELP
jgi:hypothetical protein